MKKIIVSLSVLVFLCQCNKTSHVIGGYGDAIGDVQIYYRDSLGNPLFTNGQNGYYIDSVEIYDLNNNPKRYIDPSLTFFASWGSSLLDISDIHWTVVNAHTKILIHLKEGVEDTLVGHYYNNDSKSSCYDSTYYNGVLKSLSYSVDTFVIVKNH